MVKVSLSLKRVAPPYSGIERSRNSNRYLKIPEGDLGL